MVYKLYGDLKWLTAAAAAARGSVCALLFQGTSSRKDFTIRF